jgi:hypothetical protein
VVTNAAADSSANVVYFGKSTPPSGGDFDENAYILNVQLPTGGYLDGLALEYTSTTNDNNDETTKILQRRRFDENPNACGHCINHSSTRANAEVIYIDWTDIMLGQQVVQNDESLSPACSISKEDNDDQCYYPIPNIVRADKSPWYSVIGEKHCDNNNNDSIDDGIVRFTGHGKCCGAVFCATRDINAEEEILFDYALFPPLASWAKDWYDQSQ